MRTRHLPSFLPLQHTRANSTHNARWLATSKARLGALFLHGATADETRAVGAILQKLARDWRAYVAGSEGYLVSEKRCGLYRFPVAWGDMVCHVNNVRYARWAESARIQWAMNLARHVDPENGDKWNELWTPRGLGLILRSIKLDYKFPVKFPDKVTVYHKLGSVAEDGFKLDVVILSEKHQRVAARCLEDIVVYNYKPADPAQKPGKAPVPQFMQRVFNDTLLEQKEAAEDAKEAMREIDEKIGALESQVLGRIEMT